MNKLYLLACLLVPFAASAQTAPKVVFVGEYFTPAWQATPQFTANKNWIGAGLQNPGIFSGSGDVAAAFQSTLSQHPAFVHIMTGFGDFTQVKDSTPLRVELQNWERTLPPWCPWPGRPTSRSYWETFRILTHFLTHGSIDLGGRKTFRW